MEVEGHPGLRAVLSLRGPPPIRGTCQRSLRRWPVFWPWSSDYRLLPFGATDNKKASTVSPLFVSRLPTEPRVRKHMRRGANPQPRRSTHFTDAKSSVRLFAFRNQRIYLIDGIPYERKYKHGEIIKAEFGYLCTSKNTRSTGGLLKAQRTRTWSTTFKQKYQA